MKKAGRIFDFDSGVRIGVCWHNRLQRWCATKEVPPEYIFSIGYGSTPRQAIRSLRSNLAEQVQKRLSQGPKVIFDELGDIPVEAWEILKGRINENKTSKAGS